MIENIHIVPDVSKGFEQKALKYSRKIHTVSCGFIQTSDISFPRNRKGSYKPLKTLWKSTMGVQSPSTLPTDTTSGCCRSVYRPANLHGLSYRLDR